jgi:hypothetical protein
MRAVALAILLGGCHTLAGGGGKAQIDADCLLLGDGAICTFSNHGGPGSRCVRVLLGALEGTVVASSPLCSGRLGRDGQMTVVVKFSKSPHEMCGAELAACSTKVVDRDEASGVATTWAAELKQHYSGPPTEEECKAINVLKYKFFADEDCQGGTPQEKDSCVHELMTERDENMRQNIQDCVQYDTRQLVNCTLQAKSTSDVSQCEDQYPAR